MRSTADDTLRPHLVQLLIALPVLGRSGRRLALCSAPLGGFFGYEDYFGRICKGFFKALDTLMYHLDLDTVNLRAREGYDKYTQEFFVETPIKHRALPLSRSVRGGELLNAGSRSFVSEALRSFRAAPYNQETKKLIVIGIRPVSKCRRMREGCIGRYVSK